MVTQSDTRSSPHSGRRNIAARRRINVLVVDDHPAVRAGVRKLIDDQLDMLVVAEAASAREALGKLDRLPDVIILDYHLGGARNGLWLTRRVSGLKRPPSVLIYSAFADEALAAAAIVAGADGLLGKRALGDELCNTVRRLASGRHSLPKVSRSIVQAMGSRLDPEDQAIFGMLLHGVDQDVVAKRLAVSASELDARRGRMLLALAPKTGTSSLLGGAHAPLDYAPIRAELNGREVS
jgi:DNA-binding NarL/FixJ family response regulator